MANTGGSFKEAGNKLRAAVSDTRILVEPVTGSGPNAKAAASWSARFSLWAQTGSKIRDLSFSISLWGREGEHSVKSKLVNDVM